MLTEVAKNERAYVKHETTVQSTNLQWHGWILGKCAIFLAWFFTLTQI